MIPVDIRIWSTLFFLCIENVFITFEKVDTKNDIKTVCNEVKIEKIYFNFINKNFYFIVLDVFFNKYKCFVILQL